jgi:hypothetical protein
VTISVVRQRQFRAVLSCGTCRCAVAIGPLCDFEPLAAYELGRLDGVTCAGVLHLGVCGGGALRVTIEEAPNNPPPGLTSV